MAWIFSSFVIFFFFSLNNLHLAFQSLFCSLFSGWQDGKSFLFVFLERGRLAQMNKGEGGKSGGGCCVFAKSCPTQRPHGQQHTRLPCPPLPPQVSPNSCPSSQWCHPTISSSAMPFFSRLHYFPASGSFPASQFFTSGGQSIGPPAAVLLMSIQSWFSLRLTGLISLKSKGLERVFSNSTVQKHQFSGAQPASWFRSHVHTWPLEKP